MLLDRSVEGEAPLLTTGAEPKVRQTLTENLPDPVFNETWRDFERLHQRDGQPGAADLALAPGLWLIVSLAALELLKSAGLEHAEIAPIPT